MTPSTCWNTISSGKSAIGQDRAVAAAADELGVDARERRARPGRSRPAPPRRSRGRSRRRSAPRAPAAMRQSCIVVPSGVISRARRMHPTLRGWWWSRSSRPTPWSAGTRRRVQRRRSGTRRRATTNATASRPARSGCGRGSRLSVGAEQHQRVDRCPRRRPSRMPVASSPRCAGTLPQASAYELAAGVEGDAPGQEARGEAELERAAHVAAPQRREELHARQRGERRGRLHHRRRATPPATGARGRRRCRRRDRRARSPPSRWIRSPRRCRHRRGRRANCSAIAPTSPGAWRSTAVTSRVSPWPRRDVDERHAEIRPRRAARAGTGPAALP